MSRATMEWFYTGYPKRLDLYDGDRTVTIEWLYTGIPDRVDIQDDDLTLDDCESFVETIKMVLLEHARKKKEKENGKEK